MTRPFQRKACHEGIGRQQYCIVEYPSSYSIRPARDDGDVFNAPLLDFLAHTSAIRPGATSGQRTIAVDSSSIKSWADSSYPYPLCILLWWTLLDGIVDDALPRRIVSQTCPPEMRLIVLLFQLLWLAASLSMPNICICFPFIYLVLCPPLCRCQYSKSIDMRI